MVYLLKSIWIRGLGVVHINWSLVRKSPAKVGLFRKRTSQRLTEHFSLQTYVSFAKELCQNRCLLRKNLVIHYVYSDINFLRLKDCVRLCSASTPCFAKEPCKPCFAKEPWALLAKRALKTSSFPAPKRSKPHKRPKH